MTGLVLSLFPGIGMFDMAFEEAGFCVVRGPDLLWSGDIRRFHPPAGRFDGVIGGPPCQHWSRLSHLVRHVYGDAKVAPDLIPEFARCIAESRPAWWLMEEVPEAPVPDIPGFRVYSELVRDVWVGGETTRLRRFSFGTPSGRRLEIEQLALHRPDPLPAVLASGGSWAPVALGGSGKRKKVRRANGRIESHGIYGNKSSAYFEEARAAQGLPDGFDLPGMTVTGKIRAIGNGVPLAMGRAIAAAVVRAVARSEE